MNALRQSLRQKRRDINIVDRDKLANNLLSNIKKIVNFNKDQKIALYLPNDGEVDPKSFFQNTYKTSLKNKK